MLDRKHPPLIHQKSEIAFLKAETSTLVNGIPFHVMNYGEQELMRIQFVFPAGRKYQKNSPIASAVSELILEGTNRLSAAEIALEIENKGAFVDTEINDDTSLLSLYCLTGENHFKHVEELLLLIKEVLFEASFPKKELEIFKRTKSQEFMVNERRVSFIAKNNFLKFLLGSEHAYANQLNAEDFTRLDRSDLLEFYQSQYLKGGMEIYISGRISAQIMDLLNSTFGSIENPAINENINLPLTVNAEKSREKVILLQEAVQSAIRMGSVSVEKSHPDYVPLYVANTILGGYFGSRLMANIREDKGYTYGIGSALVSSKHLNYFLIMTEVGVEYTKSCLDEIRKEMDKLATELVPDSELELVKNYLRGRILKSFDGAFSAMDRFRTVHTLGLNYTYYENLLETIYTLTPIEIRRVAQEYLTWDKMRIVIAGKK